MRIKKWILISLCLLSSNAFSLDENRIKNPQPGTVALTFDDGPSVKYTPQILAILKKYNIKATFFMVGMNAKAHPEIVQMVLADGHAINSHSMTHAMLTHLNSTALQREVATPSVIIEQSVGLKPTCLRYPYGVSNEHVRTVIRENGMIPVPMGWNSFDYERPGVDKIVSNVLSNIHSGQVILMHDGFDKREQTVAALPRIIEGIQKKGLGFSQICVNR